MICGLTRASSRPPKLRELSINFNGQHSGRWHAADAEIIGRPSLKQSREAIKTRSARAPQKTTSTDRTTRFAVVALMMSALYHRLARASDRFH